LLQGQTQDPFVNRDTPDDPFASQEADLLIEAKSSIHDIRTELKGYYQYNSLREYHPFNPYLNDTQWLDDSKKNLGLDIAVESNWSTRWTSRIRAFSRYQSFDREKPDKKKSSLLEAAVRWNADNNRLNFELGRRKPQWSEGYSYDIANLLQPQRTKPYVDQDDPLQNKGWDMFSFQYIDESWSYSGFWVDSESEFYQSNSEFVLRLAYQGDHTASFILHQITYNQLAMAVTFGGLLSDNLSLRTEWTAHPYRQKMLITDSDVTNEYYQRLVIGANYTADSGWSLLVEMFHNQHGLSDSEWQQQSSVISAAALRIINEQSPDPAVDYGLAFSGFDYIRSGWLRKNYLSLLLTSIETENSWQLRLNNQLNIDDKSYLSRLELIKSINDNLSARFQIENFSGCDVCEYGLNPNESTSRIVFSWLF
jgi:hypothetical protein